MPKLRSAADLKRIRDSLQPVLRVRNDTATKIFVGMGTCGLAAGARRTLLAILSELERCEIDANVMTMGCIGMCLYEPVVQIEKAGQLRVTYGKITPDKVPKLIGEHLISDRIVEEWVITPLCCECMR